MSYPPKTFWKQLRQVVSVIPKPYIDALTVLHEKLADVKTKWVINGDLAECMKVVQTEPNGIEIVTSKEGVQQINLALQEFHPPVPVMQLFQLSRSALIDGKEYPVYARSLYFDLELNGVAVKVLGDLQFKVGDWDWGDIYDFTPEYVYIVGKRFSVTPLNIKLQFYKSLGWVDKFEQIKQAMQRPVQINKSDS